MPLDLRAFGCERRRPDAVSRDHIAVHMPQPCRSDAGPDAVACRDCRSDAVSHARSDAVAAGHMPYPFAGQMPHLPVECRTYAPVKCRSRRPRAVPVCRPNAVVAGQMPQPQIASRSEHGIRPQGIGNKPSVIEQRRSDAAALRNACHRTDAQTARALDATTSVTHAPRTSRPSRSRIAPALGCAAQALRRSNAVAANRHGVLARAASARQRLAILATNAMPPVGCRAAMTRDHLSAGHMP